jgi:heme O synthase-like polyprenyltransferase
LILASVAPAFLGMASMLYAVGAVVAGALFFVPCVRAARECTQVRARSAFIASVTYLPVLLALLVLDRVVG